MVLKKQAEEVVADAQEGEILEKEMHIIAETPIVADDTSKMEINKDEFHAYETREDAKEEINSVIAKKETPVDVEKVASGTAETNTSEEVSIQALFEQLKEMNVKVVDKSKNGGALWIVGGKNLTPIMKSFKKLGIHFSFKAGGGKATGKKDGWWAKTDIDIP